jgi:CRP-like cAMP-binding protein
MNPVDALLRYPMFALLGSQSLTAWTQMAQRVVLQTGLPLLEEGAQGRHVCVLLRGRVRILRRKKDERECSLGIFGPGAVFGEYALLKPHLNTATCRACEECEVMQFPLLALQSVLSSLPRVVENLKCWLRLHALVQHHRHGFGMGFLTAGSLVPLIERCRDLAIPAGRTIQAEGVFSDGWFFIQRGEVALLSKENEPRMLTAGDCFGERALYGKGTIPLATTLQDTECWYLSREDFLCPPEVTGPQTRQTLNPPSPARHWHWFAQRRAEDCGVASLCMVLHGLGVDVTFEKIASLTPLCEQGVSLQTLALTAAALNLRATAVRVGLEQLSHTRLPAIAHFNDGHYVALFDTIPQRNCVLVGDPAKGIAEIPLAVFLQRWSGNLLLLSPGGNR